MGAMGYHTNTISMRCPSTGGQPGPKIVDSWCKNCQNSGSSTLRALSCGNLVVPRTRRLIGDRVFFVAAPWAWNRLPTELKLLRSTDLFRRNPNALLFDPVYGHQDTDWLCDAPSVFYSRRRNTSALVAVTVSYRWLLVTFVIFATEYFHGTVRALGLVVSWGSQSHSTQMRLIPEINVFVVACWSHFPYCSSVEFLGVLYWAPSFSRLR